MLFNPLESLLASLRTYAIAHRRMNDGRGCTPEVMGRKGYQLFVFQQAPHSLAHTVARKHPNAFEATGNDGSVALVLSLLWLADLQGRLDQLDGSREERDCVLRFLVLRPYSGNDPVGLFPV